MSPALCLHVYLFIRKSVSAAISWRRESVWLKVHQSNTSWQPRRLDPQRECQSSLFGNISSLKWHWLFISLNFLDWSGSRLQTSPACICDLSLMCVQGFTYVAPSVLENIKEKFSFEPKIRSPRRIMGSPRTPLRYGTAFFQPHPWK